jgi:hypothetical protein
MYQGPKPRIGYSEGDKSAKALFLSNKTGTQTFHHGLRNSLLPKEKFFVHRYIKIAFIRSEHTMSKKTFTKCNESQLILFS